MNPENPEVRAVSRREVLKTLGEGAALLGLARVSLGAAPNTSASGAGAGGPTGTTQPFTLPPLGYAFDALEPYSTRRRRRSARLCATTSAAT
jgi:hypothetical protein